MKCRICRDGTMHFYEKKYKDGKINDIFICDKCFVKYNLSAPSINYEEYLYDNFVKDSNIVYEYVNAFHGFYDYYRNKNNFSENLSVLWSFSGKTILDFGCGGGFTSIAAALENAKNVFCVDKNLLPLKNNLSFYKDLNNIIIGNTIDIIDEKIEVIILHHVLEHLTDPHKILEPILTKLISVNSQIILQIPLYIENYIEEGHYYFHCQNSIFKFFKFYNFLPSIFSYDYTNSYMTAILNYNKDINIWQ